jgi:uncharacterized protein (DUF362 family)
MNRREFIEHTLWISGGLIMTVAGCKPTRAGSDATSVGKPPESIGASPPAPRVGQARSTVALVRTDDRVDGIRRAIEMVDLTDFHGKRVFLKPNFNSADAPPGSTHMETLREIVAQLQQRKAERIAVGDRSGMGETRNVMRRKGVFTMADELDFDTIVFDELRRDDWAVVRDEGHHWGRGFAMPRPVLDAEAIVQTCCLKTHRYGGHFTMSLKNSVGLAAKYLPGDDYDYMRELHGSSAQRLMIAEINTAYRPSLIVLDGIEAFVRGGPAQGKRVQSRVMMVGTDPVAIDAVAVAVLRHFGTTSKVSRGSIFELEQIARAAQLGVGVARPEQIEIVSDDAAGREFASTLRGILDA